MECVTLYSPTDNNLANGDGCRWVTAAGREGSDCPLLASHLPMFLFSCIFPLSLDFNNYLTTPHWQHIFNLKALFVSLYVLICKNNSTCLQISAPQPPACFWSSTLFCDHLNSTAAEEDTAAPRLTSRCILTKHHKEFLVDHKLIRGNREHTPGQSLCTITTTLQQNPLQTPIRKTPECPKSGSALPWSVHQYKNVF